MKYDYFCRSCSDGEDLFTFEIEHPMDRKPKVKCPRCGGRAETAFLTIPISYVRGNGWLDKKGRRRDMHLHKLVNDDPYAGMRMPGEKADIADRLRKGGRRKKNPRHFAVNGRSHKARKGSVK